MTRPFAKQIRAAAGMAAASLLLAAGAHAATRTLYVGMNGGSMEKTYTDFVFKAFEKANDVKIVVVPGTSSDIMAKALAARAKPQMHVMFLDDGLMYRAIRMGLCEKQPASAAGKALYPQAHIEGDMATGVTMSMTGLGYNTRVFKEKNWAAADPAYAAVVSSYPNSSRVRNALYKRGQVAVQLGNIPQARQYFEQVIARFPRTDEAELAAETLKTLR